jgi:hypothetical protein
VKDVLSKGYTLVFGTEVDNSSTILGDSNMTTANGILTLDLSGHTGGPVYYFEDTSAGMGYIGYDTVLTDPLLSDSYKISTSQHILYKNKVSPPSLFSTIQTQGSPTTIYIKFKTYTSTTSSRQRTYLLYSASINTETANAHFVRGHWPFYIEYLTNKNKIYIHPGADGYYGPITISYTSPVLKYDTVYHLFVKLNTYRYDKNAPTDYFDICLYNDSDTTIETGKISNTVRIHSGQQPEITVASGRPTDGQAPIGDNVVSHDPSLNVYFINVYDKYTISGEDQSLIRYANAGYKSEVSMVNFTPVSETETYDISYSITVSGSPSVFYLDGVANPSIQFEEEKTYIFDQSDSTNAGHPIVFGPTADLTTNILGPNEGVTMVGTPGQPGAYTQLVVPLGTIQLTYYCYKHINMGPS